jgi:hypothetical protein
MALTLKTDTEGRAVLKDGHPTFTDATGRDIVLDVGALQARLGEAETSAKVAHVFAHSAWARENLSIPSEMAQAQFGSAFRQERGALVAYDENGEKLYSRRRPGEVADPEEAIELLVARYPHRDRITKAPATTSPSTPAQPQGGKAMSRAAFEAMTPRQRMDHCLSGGTIHA